MLAFHLRVGITAAPDEASVGDDNVAAGGIVPAFTGLLVVLVQDSNINIETNAVIINPSIILGPGNWNSGSSRLIKSVWDGLKFYTKGVNGYVDVRDIAKTMILLMNSEIKSERFIVSSENIDYQSLFNYIAAGLNKTPPKYKAAKFLSELVWRADKIKTSILKTKPLITKETARTANAKSYYSNEKIISAINYKFIPISQSIEHICKLFIQDNP